MRHATISISFAATLPFACAVLDDDLDLGAGADFSDIHQAAAAIPYETRTALSAEPLSGFVIARDDAELFSRAHASAPVGQLHRHPDDDTVRSGYPFRVVADHGDFVEVASVPPSERAAHCYGPRYLQREVLLHAYAFSAFVHRSDLLPVTRQAVERTYPDGTGFRLASGVVVGAPDADNLGAWSVDGAPEIGTSLVPLAVPDEAIGLSYTAAALPDPTEGTRLGRLRPDAFASFGASVLLGEELPYMLQYVVAAEAADGVTLATLSSRCLEIDAAIDDYDSDGAVNRCRNPTRPAFEHGYIVPAGVLAWWPDGTPAGMTLEEVALSTLPLAVEGDHVCFAVPTRWDLDAEHGPGVVLCHSAAEVQHR